MSELPPIRRPRPEPPPPPERDMPKRLRWCEDEIKRLKNRSGDLEPSVGSTYLRLTWAGGFGSEADFDGGGSTYEKLVTFEDPSTLVQSGGFVFSDHPAAVSIDWSGPTVVGQNHHLHRIEVPSSGVYTLILNYFLNVQFTPDAFGSDGHVDFIEVETKVRPDTIRSTAWFAGHHAAWTGTVSRASSAVYTVELFVGTPFWITVNPFGLLSDGTDAPAGQGPIRLTDASLSLFKD